MLHNRYTFSKLARNYLYSKFSFVRRGRTLMKSLSYRRKIHKLWHQREKIIRGNGRPPLFNRVELETINRCNGECSFCPVNREKDSRPFKKMSTDLFSSIISQLSALNYQETLNLYSNNEPLLDTRLERLAAEARRLLPRATLVLSTNGTLLTPQRFYELMPSLDLLIIDNYDNSLQLIEPVKKIREICLARPELEAKVLIEIRRKDQIMTSRAGQAPNLYQRTPAPKVGCPLPSIQFIIRPDGCVSLCCNDALGKMCLGDLSRDSLIDIWYSEAYENLRRTAYLNRRDIPFCRHCDTML